MPPKKQKANKPSPVVVGTVSTRSTRRQSIVNIEIPTKSRNISKTKKLAKSTIERLPSKSQSIEKYSSSSTLRSASTKVTSLQTSKTKSITNRKGKGRPKKSPTILELLKDWSDDESSQNSSESTDNQQSSSDSAAGDKQRLISILEGGQSPEQNIIKSENDSTDFEESVVIEECIVDDGACIILDEPDMDNGVMTDEIVHEEIISSSNDALIVSPKPINTDAVEQVIKIVAPEESSRTLQPRIKRLDNIETETVELVALQSISKKEHIAEDLVLIQKMECSGTKSGTEVVDEFKDIEEEMKKTNLNPTEFSKKSMPSTPLSEAFKDFDEMETNNSKKTQAKEVVHVGNVSLVNTKNPPEAKMNQSVIQSKPESSVNISSKISNKTLTENKEENTSISEERNLIEMSPFYVDSARDDCEENRDILRTKENMCNQDLSSSVYTEVEEQMDLEAINDAKKLVSGLVEEYSTQGTVTKQINEVSASEQIDNVVVLKEIDDTTALKKDLDRLLIDGDQNHSKYIENNSVSIETSIAEPQKEEGLNEQFYLEENTEESLCSQMTEGLKVTEKVNDRNKILIEDHTEQESLELKVKELNIVGYDEQPLKENKETANVINITENDNFQTSGSMEEKPEVHLDEQSCTEETNSATALEPSKCVLSDQVEVTLSALAPPTIPVSRESHQTDDDIIMKDNSLDPSTAKQLPDFNKTENLLIDESEGMCVLSQNVTVHDEEVVKNNNSFENIEGPEINEKMSETESEPRDSKLTTNSFLDVEFKQNENKDKLPEIIGSKEIDNNEQAKSCKPKLSKKYIEKLTRKSLRVKEPKTIKSVIPSTPPPVIVTKDDNKLPNAIALKSPKQLKMVKASKEAKVIENKSLKERKVVEGKPQKDSKFSKDLAVKDTKKKKACTKKPKELVDKKDKAKSFEEALKEDRRRSSRIKSITVQKKPEVTSSLVKSKSDSTLNESQFSDTSLGSVDLERFSSASPKVAGREKLSKSRAKSTENLATVADGGTSLPPGNASPVISAAALEKVKALIPDPEVTLRLKQFVHLKENQYKTDRQTCKEAKKMVCDCFFTEEISKNSEEQVGCGDDCLNRLLLIECGNLCPMTERCTNKRFQKAHFAPVEVFKTEKKGLGLRAAANIPYGEFILEYVGEVLNPDEFEKRAENYSHVKNIHYYFMSLRSDAIIDATMKGNISRFINHSCDPNAETQKWTVNGELRIGFFSTRTILAGEEVTFDYRFQRYGKEAQKCYCEAATCRGWLGEQPDDESEEDEEDEEEMEEEAVEDAKAKEVLVEGPEFTAKASKGLDEEMLLGKVHKDVTVQEPVIVTTVTPIKRKTPKRKPRKDIFEDLDQLEDEIEMLVTTGLKNQAHTLKLSRLMVRAKEPEQRKKLLRILRRGELPCRRLFLDYHGLRLMHGYMIDAQHLASTDKKFESLRLEILQTLAVLPIPNKTMLQDSKVLATVGKWATSKNLQDTVEDSDSNSPKIETTEKHQIAKNKEDTKEQDIKDPAILDQEEEIRFLAGKLVEEWSNLKEVFKIPKKERIEQMKEHEREANRKFLASSYAQEQDTSRKSDHRYRTWSRYKIEKENYGKKGFKPEDKDRPSAAFLKISKHERRKLFALQMEVREEERRMKQREMWRQHELNCMVIGTDPRFTAPFDPSRGYQCIWNPAIGQWQNYPLPPENQSGFGTPPSSQSIALPNLSVPPPQRSAILGYRPAPPIGISTSIPSMIKPVQAQSPMLPGMPPGSAQMKLPPLPVTITSHSSIPTPLPLYQEVKIEEDPSLVKFAGPIPPPVKLPPKWKCGKDKYGRPYYYHIKLRKSQWEPPPFSEELESKFSSESSSSSDTSSVSSETSSDNSESEDEIDDTQLLQQVRKHMEKTCRLGVTKVEREHVKTEKVDEPSPPVVKNESEDEEDVPEEKPVIDNIEEDMEIDDETLTSAPEPEEKKLTSIDIRLKEVFNLKDDSFELESKPPKKKKRVGLCQEIRISPRTDEDKQHFKEDLKRYKANKERLKRQKELILQQTRKQLREIGSCSSSASGAKSSSISPPEQKKAKEKRHRSTLKSRIKDRSDMNSEHAKKIKETFRSCMATTVVGVLNAYRKPDCKEARITNTEEFKHLARKLTHFVMLKEIKHIENIEDLICTDNVKAKAREYIRKYMSKFGEVYQKRHDEPDFRD